MLDTVVNTISKNNTINILEHLDFGVQNGLYIMLDIDKPLKEQDISSNTCFVTGGEDYNSKNISNMNIFNEVKEYMPYLIDVPLTRNLKNSTNLIDKSNLFFVNAIRNDLKKVKLEICEDGKTIKQSETLKGKHKDINSNLESENYCKSVFDIFGNNINKPAILKYKDFSGVIKETNDDYIKIIEDTFNFEWFKSAKRKKVWDSVENFYKNNDLTFLIDNAINNFYEIKHNKKKNKKTISKKKLNGISNKNCIFIILRVGSDFAKEEYINLSKFLSFKILDKNINVSKHTNYIDSSNKLNGTPQFKTITVKTKHNTINSSIKQSNIFNIETEMSRLNYFYFIKWMIQFFGDFKYIPEISRGVGNKSDSIKSLLVSKNLHDDVSYNHSNTSVDGFIIDYSLDAKVAFILESVKEYQILNNQEPSFVFKEFKKEINDEKTLIVEQLNTLNTKEDFFKAINRNFFNNRLITNNKSLKNVKFKNTIDKNKKNLDDFMLKSDINWLTKNKKLLSLMIQINFEDLFITKKEYGDNNILYTSENSILTSLNIYDIINNIKNERRLILNSTEIKDLLERYTSTMEFHLTSEKEYLFLIGNLSRVIYNLSNNKNKYQFIDKLYKSKDSETLLDNLIQLWLKYQGVVVSKAKNKEMASAMINKFNKLLKALIEFKNDNNYKLTKDDSLGFMFGFMHEKNLMYTSKNKKENEVK